MAYYFGGAGPGGAGGNLRFLIPLFPFLAVAGVWLLAEIGGHLGPAGRPVVLVVVLLQLVVGLGSSVPALTAAQGTLGGAARVRRAVEQEVPAGCVLIADRQLAESLDATGRWKLVEEGLAAGLGQRGLFGPPGAGSFPGQPGGNREGRFRPPASATEARGPDMADDDPSPMQRGKNRAQRERYAGLSTAERTSRLWADVRAWAGDKPVYWLARSLELTDNALPEEADYRILGEIEAPLMMGPAGGGPGGAGRAGFAKGAGRGQPGAGGPARGFVPAGRAGPMGMRPDLAGRLGLPGEPGGRGGFAADAPLRLLRLEWPKQ
jgi:hypothetical protein